MTKTADTNDGTCDADCSLREAIDAANTQVGSDDVVVPAGNYLLGALGGLNVTEDFDLEGANAHTTDIGIGPPFSNSVFTIQAGVAGAISRIAIMGSDVNYSSADVAGVIHNLGTLELTDVTVKDGASYDSGGGIYNAGTLSLTNTTLANNRNFGYHGGGGIYNKGMLTLTNSTVSDGYSQYQGGGIRNGGFPNPSGATATVTNSTIRGNHGAQGGGGVFNRGILRLYDSTVDDNRTREAFGGAGIYNRGVLTIRGSTISRNVSLSNSGGGIYNEGGDVSLTNSTVSGNTASYGGGISGAATLLNTTVTDNYAEYRGGDSPAPLCS